MARRAGVGLSHCQRAASRPWAGAMATEAAALTQDFKQAMRRVASTVNVITVCVGGEPMGITATAMSSLSLDPPSLLICINAPLALQSARGRPFLRQRPAPSQEAIARCSRPEPDACASLGLASGLRRPQAGGRAAAISAAHTAFRQAPSISSRVEARRWADVDRCYVDGRYGGDQIPRAAAGGGPCEAWWWGSWLGVSGSRAILGGLRQLPLHHPSGGPPPHLRWGGLRVTP